MQVHLSNRRLGLVTDELEKAAPGTVEAALRNLIAYRSSLENRLLARFMDACSESARRSVLAPSDCVRIFCSGNLSRALPSHLWCGH